MFTVSVNGDVDLPSSGPVQPSESIAAPLSHTTPGHVESRLSDEVSVELQGHDSSTIGELTSRINLIDRQVADLQIDQVAGKRCWHRDPSILIALFALVFSFGTTLFSAWEARQQNIIAARGELRGLLERTSGIQQEYMRLTATITNSAVLRNTSIWLQTENAMLTRQASEIIDRIPDNIPASEYTLVAMAMEFSNQSDEALRLYTEAERVSNNANDKVTALRSKASLLFRFSRFEEGRAAMQDAVDVFQDFPSQDTPYVNLTHADTENYWVALEYHAGHCEEFKQHLQDLKSYVARLEPTQAVHFDIQGWNNQLCTPRSLVAQSIP